MCSIKATAFNGAGGSLRRLPLSVPGAIGVLSGAIMLFATWSGGPAYAQAQDGGAPASAASTSAPLQKSDILTVDRDQLFSGSLYGQRILAELELERARLAAEARKVEAALAAEEQDLTKQRKSLSPEAFRALANAFDEKVQALRREGPAREQRFSDRFERERLAYFEKIGPILGAVVRERGGVVIVDRRAILLTTRNIDVTDAAIARINALLGDGSDAGAENGSDGPASASDEVSGDSSAAETNALGDPTDATVDAADPTSGN